MFVLPELANILRMAVHFQAPPPPAALYCNYPHKLAPLKINPIKNCVATLDGCKINLKSAPFNNNASRLVSISAPLIANFQKS